MHERFSKWVVVFLVCLMAFSVSCSSGGENAAPDSASEAYIQFMEKLEKCSELAKAQKEASEKKADKKKESAQSEDGEAKEDPVLACKLDIWNNIDTNSKNQFAIAYMSLVRVDRIIEIYFDLAEHKEMRERTGTRILEDQNIHSPQDLFVALFKPEDLVFNEFTKQGGIPTEEFQDPDYRYIVTVNTEAEGQSFVMIHENDGIWRNAGFFNIISNALEPVAKTENALREYAKDNVIAEIDRRVDVIEYAKDQNARRAIRRQLEAK